MGELKFFEQNVLCMLINKIVVFGVLRMAQVIEERPLHLEKVIEYVIGPYLVENDDGTAVTINSERIDHMQTDCY